MLSSIVVLYKDLVQHELYNNKELLPKREQWGISFLRQHYLDFSFESLKSIYKSIKPFSLEEAKWMTMPKIKSFQTNCALLYGYSPITVKNFVTVYNTVLDRGNRGNVLLRL